MKTSQRPQEQVKKNAYVLLGWAEKSMEWRVKATQEQISKNLEENPLIFITGTPTETQFFSKKLEGLEKWYIYQSSKAYDTLTNFTKDIKPLLEKYLQENTTQKWVNFVIVSGDSHIWRIKKITKLLKKDKVFKECTFQCISDKHIFEPKSELLLKPLYKLGPLGIHISNTLAYILRMPKIKKEQERVNSELLHTLSSNS